MATEHFRSPRLMIANAERHISHFASEATAFVGQENLHAIVREFQPPDADVIKIKLTKTAPHALSAAAFDCIVNLRSALDQATYAIAVAAGETGKRAAFPFGDDAGEVAARHVGKGGSSQLPKRIFDLVASCKPYKGGNVPLWAINKLCNPGKHEIVSPAVAVATSNILEHLFMEKSRSFQFPPIWDSAKQEMEVCVVDHGTKVEANFKVSTFIAFCDLPELRQRPAVGVIQMMHANVVAIVDALEAEASAMGLF